METSKRSLIKLVAALTAWASSPRISTAIEQRALSADEWLADALITKSSDSPLKMQRFRDPVYILLEPIEWRPSDERIQLPTIIVPAGFVTDLASIPRIFWSIFHPAAEYAYAAIVHDYLYWAQSHQKEIADEIFRRSMIDFEIDQATLVSLHSAVVLFGNSAWRNNAALKAEGEKRLIRKFPDNARVTWSEWKRRSDVY